MAEQNDEFQIFAGPSKFSLMAAIFGDNGDRLVTFRMRKCEPGTRELGSESQVTVEVIILGVDRVSGEHECWTIRGSICEKGFNYTPFTCCYETRRRTGHLTVLKE